MSNSITIEVQPGPVLRTAMDVLDLAQELINAIPDYHPGRAELISRAITLSDVAQAELVDWRKRNL